MLRKTIISKIKWHDKEKNIYDENYHVDVRLLGIKVFSKSLKVAHNTRKIDKKDIKILGFRQ